jgi:hypothetical protein
MIYIISCLEFRLLLSIQNVIESFFFIRGLLVNKRQIQNTNRFYRLFLYKYFLYFAKDSFVQSINIDK